jgi:transcriptional regulator with XRE-family HTH domain
MVLGERMKRIREIRGLNLKEMAVKMKITAPTYANLEEEVNPKYTTVKKFCDAVEVNISVLMAEDMPITEDVVLFFDSMKPKSFLLIYEQLRQRVDVYGEVLRLNADTSIHQKASFNNQ